MAVVRHVANGECEHFGDPKAEEHLGSDEGAIARFQATYLSEEDSFFVCGERARAGKTRAIAEIMVPIARAAAPGRA